MLAMGGCVFGTLMTLKFKDERDRCRLEADGTDLRRGLELPPRRWTCRRLAGAVTSEPWPSRLVRASQNFVGPEATSADNIGTLGAGIVGVVIARRNASASAATQLVLSALAGDLWGGAWANNTRACARWYERPGQSDADHYRFAALHLHPFLLTWLDREQRHEPSRWIWAALSYCYLVGSTVLIRRRFACRRRLGFGLAAGGILLDQALGPAPAAAWFGWAFYPKLLLGHASAALWSDRDLAHRYAGARAVPGP